MFFHVDFTSERQRAALRHRCPAEDEEGATPALSRCFSAGGPLCCVLALNPAVGGSEDVLGWVFQRAPQAADVGCGRWAVLGAGGNHRPVRGADRAAAENAGYHLEARSKVIQNRCVRLWKVLIQPHTVWLRCVDKKGRGRSQRGCWWGTGQGGAQESAEEVTTKSYKAAGRGSLLHPDPIIKKPRGKGWVQGYQTYGPGTQKWHAKGSNPAGLCSSGWDHYSIVLQYCVWKYNPPNTASPGLTQGLWSRMWEICESETMCLFYYFHQFKVIKTLLTLLKTLLRHFCVYSAGRWCRAFHI